MAWTKLKTATLATGILLLAGTATVVIRNGQMPANAVKQMAQSSPFPFAGYDTPDNAFQSVLWALGTGDLEKVLACCTPDQKERFKKKMEGKSEGEITSGMIAWAHNMIGYQLSKKETKSDDEVRLLLKVPPYPGHPNVGNDLQVMKKIGSDWKYAGKWGVDIKEE